MNNTNLYNKTDLQRVLAEHILSAFETKQIKIGQMQEMANYVLEKTQNISDYDQMLLFLSMLKEKWEIFKDVHGVFNAKNKVQDEKVVMDKLQSYLKGLN